ncbi:MAG: CPBP family glutamic-type intramembrane protease, partial [Acidobacteriaceae bacterium]
WQDWFGWGALAWVALQTALNFRGWESLGLGGRGFRRSIWVVGVAIAVSVGAALASAHLGGLHIPHGPTALVKRYWLYVVWAFVQEFLLLAFFLRRLVRLLGSRVEAALVTAVLFGGCHVPNPVLMPLAAAWGLIACAVFLRWKNLYPLWISHAILGICIAVSVPKTMDHGMRVGLGYLRYRSPASAPRADIISAISPRPYPLWHE